MNSPPKEFTWKYDTVWKGSLWYYVYLYLNGVEIGYAHINIPLDNKHIIYLDFLEIHNGWRNKGYAKYLYYAFADIYHNDSLLSNKVISRHFINPKAECIAKQCLHNGLFPPHSWNEQYITRDYKIYT